MVQRSTVDGSTIKSNLTTRPCALANLNSRFSFFLFILYLLYSESTIYTKPYRCHHRFIRGTLTGEFKISYYAKRIPSHIWLETFFFKCVAQESFGPTQLFVKAVTEQVTTTPHGCHLCFEQRPVAYQQSDLVTCSLVSQLNRRNVYAIRNASN